ncbi:PRC and DUF2382 domain-containing protein [Streptomyces sp. NPDC046465]|uniref:PRC and DUF2382 domain-containing protein n=1 Tax=Streptomyces sp. NPDC046465 TaxID=3155810 RepID=UPI0033E35399
MTQGEAFTNPDGLAGLTAYDQTGEKIGSVEQVYLDDRSGRPEWVTVKTGLFGMKQSFVPLAGARRQDDQLHVATTKEAVKDAPRVEADQHLEPEQEHELYRHYGLARPEGAGGMAGGMRPGTAPAAGGRGDMAGAGAGGGREFATRAGAGEHHKDEMIRSEERLRVGKEEETVGQARLRKVVVTEEVTTSVPLSHEEVRVVREPVREGDGTRARIGEEEAEVTLHAEKAVVRKEAVPVERVRLETENVTETQEVSDQVRKEQIEFDRAKGERGRGDAKGENWRDRKQGPRH